MMQLTRCDNGHYYDASKHSSCPHCGVQNLDIDFQKTVARRPSDAGSPTGASAADGEGKTVGMFRKKMGIDPVVGWLVCVVGPDRGKDFRIHSERNFIGRSEKMDIVITGDDSVSRDNHAIVSYNPKQNIFRVYPGESRGLTYLNDEEVITPQELKAFDVIELGQTKLVFIPFCSDKFVWSQEETASEEKGEG